jgi:thiopeptide-type bacteriocin biosynthesis protein
VASPSLDGEIDTWLREPTGETGRKVERSLVRYACRMAGRATPFGLFSGCSVGAIGEHTRLVLDPAERNRRHTRLDMYYVCELAEAIARLPELRAALSYRVSSSLYRTADQLYYIEASSQSGSRDYHLSVAERTPYLDATLARAAPGATRGTLANALVADDPAIPIDEATRFIDQLVDEQVLVPSLAPTVTGRESVASVIATLEELPVARELVTPLRQVAARLDQLDAGGLGHPPAVYRDLAASLTGLPVAPELPRLFQVDMVKSSPEATIGGEVLRELGRAVGLSRRLGPPVGSDSTAGFRSAFSARYGDREVPLALVLDEENGIGFESVQGPWSEASPLLRGFSFGQSGGSPAFTARDAHLAQRLAELARAGRDELELTDADWRAIETRDPAPLPASFAIMAQVAAKDDAALARGDFRILIDNVAGPSGAILLGRFCHADPTLSEHVRAMLRGEEASRPSAVFAEIVHLPEGRIGNIISRPVLRDYEIAYLGESGAPADRQLAIDDLSVAVVAGRVVLRSRRLGREVIPRLSNAHNYARRSLPIYRFLCAVQRQGVMSATGWSWGVLAGLERLPRVTAGRIVLATKRWNLGAAAVAELRGNGGIARVRERLGLPRWVAVADGDNVLPIDLDSELLVDALLQLVKSREGVELVEVFPPPDELCARGPEGGFVHELVVPFRETPPNVSTVTEATPATSVARVHPPGSEWLFAKLYGGPATLDRVLRDVVAPIVEQLRAESDEWGWFFIRYGDPDWHLRVRFHGDPSWLNSAVQSRLELAAAEAIAYGTVWKLQIDTYDREIERYGGPDGILLAERIFHADSDAVLALMPLALGDSGADRRWRHALLGMDQLLDALGFAHDGKLAVVRAVRTAFGREFGVETAFEKQLGDRYRRERLSLEALLAGTIEPDAWAILRTRSAQIAPIGDELRRLGGEGRLSTPLEDLAQSYLHMHANRMLRSSAREQELILYDFLQRLYESQQARARKRK